MQVKNADYYFLNGGGEMGEHIRRMDWGKTALGDPKNWPRSLRTMVGVMLENPFGMYIAWGREYIQLYNDGFRPILGSTKHPQALGITTPETFSEIWHIIGPMFYDVMNGKAVRFPDFMLQLNRNGFVEDCYFDFSYSPIRKDDGEVGGVLVTVAETTSKKKAIDDSKESEQKFRAMVDNIPNLAWMANADGWIFWYNKQWYEYTGTSPEEMEGWGWQSVHHPDELETVLEKWKQSIATGKPFEMVFPIKGADGRFRPFLTRVLPVFNSNGQIHQWFGTNTDITKQKEAEDALKYSEQRFRDRVKQAPVGIIILRGKEFMVEMANDAYLLLVDKKEPDFVGRPLFDSLPEVENAVRGLLDDVLNTGIPYHGIEYPIPVNRYGKTEVSYFDFLYHPLKEADGEISGIIVTVTDVSSLVFAKARVEKSDQKLRSLVDNSPFPIGVFEGEEMRIELANEAIIKTWGKGGNVIGKLFTELMPELNSQQIFAQLEEVFKTGNPYHAFNSCVNLIIDGKEQSFYFNYSFIPLYDSAGKVYGVMNTAADVTDLNVAKKKLEESEMKFRLLADSMPQHIWTSDIQGNLNYFNQSVFNYSGLSSEQIDKDGWLQIVHPDDREENVAKWMHSISTGEDFLIEHRFRRHDGLYRWQLSRAIPQKDEHGQIQMWVGTSTDIQEQKTFASELEKKVKDRTNELALANQLLMDRNESLTISETFNRSLTEVSPNVVYIHDLKTNRTVFLNKTGLKIIGIDLEKFNESDQKITDLIIHPDDIAGVKSIMEKVRTSKAGEIFEHEYRARSAQGEWIPFFARDTAFTRDHKNEAVQLLGFAVDITELKKSQSILTIKNNELERMNKELQSFAYISSHDLQEPLRKIQTFSTQIMEKELHNLSESGKDRFQRMYNAANRMQTLINDLLAYSRTNTAERHFKSTDLSIIIEEVKEDLKEELLQKQATVEAVDICQVNIIPFQFRQLIYNLISNSLKFAIDDRPPLIKIKCEIAMGSEFKNERLTSNINYCHISVSDDGIGFQPQYSEKIFEVFQRLHGRDKYQGTGIGLAIVKKIVENHNGVITASSELNKGARFDIYIPAVE